MTVVKKQKEKAVKKWEKGQYQIDVQGKMYYNEVKMKMTGGAAMKKKLTLEEAMNRIAELEKENEELKEQLEYYKKRKASGRQKHNAKWMAIYNDFVVCHEGGMSLLEIAKRNNVSERTIYRYKAYYESVKNA